MSYLTREEFEKHLNILRDASIVTVDTEGTLNHPHSETWGLSTSVDGVSEYFAFNHKIGTNLPQEWLPEIIEVLRTRPYLVMHNAKHDLRALRNLGLDYQGKFFCTMVMAHMVNENWLSKELDYLAKIFKLGRKEKHPLMQEIIDSLGWDYVPVDFMRSYGDNDAVIAEKLFHVLLKMMQEQELDGELWEWEQDWIRLLMLIEDNGVLINQSFCEQEAEKGHHIMNDIKSQLGLNPGSSKDLHRLLIEELKLPVVKKTKKGSPSFDKDAMKVYDELLSRTNDKRADLILTYRGWQKTVTSNYEPYLRFMCEDGRLHAGYKIHGTLTGRLSCENPNLQQIPKTSFKPWNGKLKSAFITVPGRSQWTIDFSQLEFRLGALYGMEHSLIEVFNDDTRDIFNEMAAELGMVRDDVKTMNYTIQYSGGVTRISEVFGLSPKAAKARIDQYYNKYPGLRKFTEMAQDACLKRRYVRYWTKRRRHFINPDKEAHKAGNSIIQGGAFEIVKRGMIKCYRAGLFNDECKPFIQIHDELGLDIENGKEDKYLPEIQRLLEDADIYRVMPHLPKIRFKTECKPWGAK